MTVLVSKTRAGFSLGDADKRRLERLAPLFDIEFAPKSEVEFEIGVRDGAAYRRAVVAASLAHMRLLTELCSKSVNWVYFRGQEHCGQTLLSLPDSKIERIAQLYALRRAAEEKAVGPEGDATAM